MMKVALVSQPIDPVLPPFQNSVGACTWGTALALAKHCEVVVFASRDMHPELSEWTAHDVRFRFVPATSFDRMAYSLRRKASKLIQISSPLSTSSLFYPGYGQRVAAALQKEKADVIHIQHCSQYIPIIRKLNPHAKIVLHLHAQWFSQTNKQMLLRRLRKLDLLTTVSDHITKKTRRDLPELQVACETVYNGIEPAEFQQEKDYQASANRKEQWILYAGGISPHKGLHVLLDAFQIVLSQQPQVRLAIVGPSGAYPFEETFDRGDRASWEDVARHYKPQSVSDLLKSRVFGKSEAPPDYNARLRTQLSSEAAGNVTFLGMIPRPELIARYHQSDLFVFPPVWDEGFGLPPVEAMAAGTPVVASRTGALPETVKDGLTGLLVPRNDSRSLAEAMLKLLGNPGLRESMGRAARQSVLDRFTWDLVAADFLAHYQRLCAPSRDHALRPTETAEKISSNAG